ncbi:Mu transposase C-terminal domain-containing protein [Streptomyces sp. WAC01490]|uniref:Mu transposase C-terminal domain-containing protein n=1 Tax=unclassified Streptomyces TaxID=2593676 RepID=UPI003F3EB2F1
MLASFLMAAPDFSVTGTEPLPGLEPSGLLAALPDPVRDAARDWERHVVEVETGLPPGAEPGTSPRAACDPAKRPLVERAQAKADELGVSLRTVQGRRARYAEQGLWALVDQRAVRMSEATGRADARLVAAIREALDAETSASTGTRSRLIRRRGGKMVVLDSGLTVRADLTIAVDVATRTICAAVLRPVGTKAADASLLPARMLVPEPMRPGWAGSLPMAASWMPHRRLLDVDTRMEQAAARPVIVPDTVVIDGGKVFISDTFIRACDRLGISVQRDRPCTSADKAIVEATFSAINTLFVQRLAGYTGPKVSRRDDRVEEQAVWTIPDLQELLDEWILAGWQARPHESLRDPFRPKKSVSPNDKYASLVADCGYLPFVLRGEDYLELLPVAWRAVNDYGIRISYRTYNCAELGPYRRQHSGITAKRGLWEVHYDPYDLSQVFVRTQQGWITVPWLHLPLVNRPFADFTWQHARRLAAEAGLDDTDEAAVARVLDELLARGEHGPDTRSAKVASRPRLAAAVRAQATAPETEHEALPPVPVADFGVFDAHAEAERWNEQA